VPVAHTSNPTYSGGRDQEDRSSKPAWANSSQDPILKNPTQKGLVEWIKMKVLSSSPSTAKKKKKKKLEKYFILFLKTSQPQTFTTTCNAVMSVVTFY
jgi:hypothetical protein